MKKFRLVNRKLVDVPSRGRKMLRLTVADDSYLPVRYTENNETKLLLRGELDLDGKELDQWQKERAVYEQQVNFYSCLIDDISLYHAFVDNEHVTLDVERQWTNTDDKGNAYINIQGTPYLSGIQTARLVSHIVGNKTSDSFKSDSSSNSKFKPKKAVTDTSSDDTSKDDKVPF